MPYGEHSQDGWHMETRAACLYRVMAEAEVGTPRAAAGALTFAIGKLPGASLM